MDFLYVLLYDREWEDTIIFLSKEEAINQSKIHKNGRVEIFVNNNAAGFAPTYNYYKNGVLFQENQAVVC